MPFAESRTGYVVVMHDRLFDLGVGVYAPTFFATHGSADARKASMARYRLRFFFDPGAGVCLWAGNEAARERLDYPIDVSALPLPENTRRRALHLCFWYDTSIDWSYPPDPWPWDTAECERFNAEAQKPLATLREQLGPEFEIVDESSTASKAARGEV